MRKTILIAAALSLVATPALAHGNNTATAIIGVVAGAGLGLAIGNHHQAMQPAYVQPVYAAPAYVAPPQPRPAPNGVNCMGWDGFRYVPVQTCR